MHSLKMKAVIQEEETGCGLASVAAIAGLSYQQIRRITGEMGISAADQSLWSETTPVRRLLARLGVENGENEHPFRRWEELPPCALLAIK